jgi:hypothetical protein
MKSTPRVPLTLGQVPVHIIAPADPAQQSTDPTRGMSGRFPPGHCGPSLRNVRLAPTRRPSPRRSAAEPRPAGRTPLRESSLPSRAAPALRVARSASVSPPSPFSACTTRPELLGRAHDRPEERILVGRREAEGPGASITPIRGPMRPQVRRRPGRSRSTTHEGGDDKWQHWTGPKGAA